MYSLPYSIISSDWSVLNMSWSVTQHLYSCTPGNFHPACNFPVRILRHQKLIKSLHWYYIEQIPLSRKHDFCGIAFLNDERLSDLSFLYIIHKAKNRTHSLFPKYAKLQHFFKVSKGSNGNCVPFFLLQKRGIFTFSHIFIVKYPGWNPFTLRVCLIHNGMGSRTPSGLPVSLGPL